MAGLSLYQIAQEHRQMVEHLMSINDDAQSIKDTIEAESYPLELKAQNVAYAIKNMEATAEAIKNAEAEMAARRKAYEKRIQNIKDYLLACMEIAGVKKIECPHFAISVVKNPGGVDLFEPKLIPLEYMKQKDPPPPEPDKSAIKEALKAGKEIPGAMLSESNRLQIK